MGSARLGKLASYFEGSPTRKLVRRSRDDLVPRLDLVHEGRSARHGSSEIVLIHGPTGDSQSTWTHETGVFWPTALLAKERRINGARIWNYSYDASASTFLDGNALDQAAEAFINALASALSQKGCKKNGTISIVAHGLGGLVAQRAHTLATRTESMVEKDINLVLLGTPYFEARDNGDEPVEPTESQLEQIRRFQVVLGKEITDPAVTFRLWHEISAAVLKSVGQPSSRSFTKIASFREGLSFDEQGTIVKEEFSKFDGREMVACHPRNVDLLGPHGYNADDQPPVFEIKSKHSDLGRFLNAKDPGYISLHKVLAVYDYYGCIMDMIAQQNGDDWFG